MNPKKSFFLNLQKVLSKFFKSFSLDLIGFIDSISNYDYILIKVDSPYTQKKFPKKYPIGKDLDIITNKTDFKNVVDKAKLFSESNKKFTTRMIENNDSFRLRFELKRQLHYQIDIRDEFNGIHEDVIKDSIQTRIKSKNFYIPSPKYEIIYRIYDFFYHKKKYHHFHYIKKNISDLDITQITDDEIREFSRNLIQKGEEI